MTFLEDPQCPERVRKRQGRKKTLLRNGFGMVWAIVVEEEGGRRRRHLGDDEGDENRPARYPRLILRYQRSVSAMKLYTSSLK